MTHPGRHTPGIPAEAVARFTAAEARLYPLALVDPASYERAVSLTGMLLEDLRSACPDIASVLQRRGALLLLLDRTTDAGLPSLTGLDPGTLVDAASAVRCRELRAEQAAGEAAARIAAAGASGQEWLVDEPDPAAVMAGFYRRVELHVPTGAALVCSAEPDGTGARTTYRLEVIPPQDADAPSDAPSAPEEAETYEDEASWALAIERRRGELSSRP